MHNMRTYMSKYNQRTLVLVFYTVNIKQNVQYLAEQQLQSDNNVALCMIYYKDLNVLLDLF